MKKARHLHVYQEANCKLIPTRIHTEALSRGPASTGICMRPKFERMSTCRTLYSPSRQPRKARAWCKGADIEPGKQILGMPLFRHNIAHPSVDVVRGTPRLIGAKACSDLRPLTCLHDELHKKLPAFTGCQGIYHMLLAMHKITRTMQPPDLRRAHCGRVHI